jgi:hypothetical protein
MLGRQVLIDAPAAQIYLAAISRLPASCRAAPLAPAMTEAARKRDKDIIFGQIDADGFDERERALE